MFALNGVFHGQLAAGFFDSNLSQLEPIIHKMKYTNPLWVGLLDTVLTFGMTYFIILPQTNRIILSQATFAGGLINFISSGAWNFANAALFLSWSITLTIVDICWHLALGTGGGLLIGILYNRLQKQGSRYLF